MTETSALAACSAVEKATVLEMLIASDSELGRRAEAVARMYLSEVDSDDVASGVAEDVLALPQDELAAHAGRTWYGYVEPTEAAWQLLESVLEPWIEDIKRRANLGMPDLARQLGLGVLQGLARIVDRVHDDNLLLSWAPDFPGKPPMASSQHSPPAASS